MFLNYRLFIIVVILICNVFLTSGAIAQVSPQRPDSQERQYLEEVRKYFQNSLDYYEIAANHRKVGAPNGHVSMCTALQYAASNMASAQQSFYAYRSYLNGKAWPMAPKIAELESKIANRLNDINKSYKNAC